MDSKPIVTCHGDQGLFSKLHNLIVVGLPKEPIEWNRSYGRPKTLHIEANFVPFNPDILPEDNDWSLPGRPFFHTYWLDCDIDTYKASVKEEISDWLTSLRDDNINDWLIVVVVNDESKVKTKILRTSVYDKVKSDFCGKNSDRCSVLTEPLKFDGKSVESWNALLARMRQLIVQSYDRNLGRFEDHMRAERERRTEKGWDFCGYFLLQEELALMFEMLRLHDDALIQYDELDALFTQYVLNHAAGDSAPWLSTFMARQNQTWDGLCLSQPININKRQLIKKGKASLLDFRNYLFSRQCALTFLMGQPGQVAQKAIPFMHNCMYELQVLEVEMPSGAMACWVFISCLEVLRLCDQYKSDSDHHYLYTASLWDYARVKMELLGSLCGLFPDLDTSSYQLNLVVDLIAGLYKETEPINKLKEALSSKAAFQRHYLELSELAMGTYKFIGRMRSARQIGRDLAAYYMKLGDWQKAEGFLQDALKMYKQGGWSMLADQIRLDIATCHEKLDDTNKLVKSCIHITTSEFLPSDFRRPRQSQMITLTKQIKDPPLLVRSKPGFWIEDVSLADESFMLHHDGQVTLILKSTFIDPIVCDRILLSAILESTSLNNSHSSISPADLRKKRAVHRSRHSSTSSASSISGIEFYDHVRQSLDAQNKMLDLYQQVELRPDNKTIAVCSIAQHGTLHRADSVPYEFEEHKLVKEDYEFVFETTDVNLPPGNNQVILKGQFPQKGHYSLGQMSVQVGGLEFLHSLTKETIVFSVICDEPTVILIPHAECVLAGVPQMFALTLNTGSYETDEWSELHLKHSNKLTVRGQEIMDGVIKMPACTPKQEVTFDLELYCELPLEYTADEAIHCEHVEVYCLALSRQFDVGLEFLCPFSVSHGLHTTGVKKFIQVIIKGTTSTEFSLKQHSLTTVSEDVELVALNKADQTLRINKNMTASYIWQLMNNNPDGSTVSCDLALQYTAKEDSTSRRLHMTFDLNDYVTLLETTTMIKLCGDASVCEVGCTYDLDLIIHALPSYKPTKPDRLRYEVVTNTDMWAVTGKTTGMFELVGEFYKMRLTAIPLMGGYLSLPQVNLAKYCKANDDVSSDSTNQNALGDDHAEVIPFSIGQVYNTSLAQRIHVIPASNTSHIDIIMNS